jgi:hypothetical protein
MKDVGATYSKRANQKNHRHLHSIHTPCAGLYLLNRILRPQLLSRVGRPQEDLIWHHFEENLLHCGHRAIGLAGWLSGW